MKRLCIFFFLLPVLGFAQDGERYLKDCASLLATNRTAQSMFFYSTKREKARLDTLSVSEQNYRYRTFNHVWQRDYEQAALWLEKTASQYPKQRGMVGEVYLTTLRDYPHALAHFEAYDALTPAFDDLINHNPVSYMCGLAHRGSGNQKKAVELFSKAIDSLAIKHGAEWVNYRHFVSRAVSYIAVEQPEKALADLENATKNFNRSALVQYHRGRALLLLNRTAEARTAFQDASFFVKALRAQRSGDYQEDNANPVYESEIDEALKALKSKP